jgi:UDP-N-acetylglucosamine--N-acetylmuramyl-(pentapeptide) pyrophosphoryl-undecaprenol N-acetylglucosamine transferase
VTLDRPTLLFAGGGTGGHVFPLIAVADAVRARADVRIVCVGTARGIETRVVPERGYELELMDVLPIRGGGLMGALRGTARAAGLVGQARALVRRISPKAVFSVGGYAAGPVSLAARTLGLPLALLEPNSEIGLSNRLMAPFVQRAYTHFEESARYFPKRAVVRTGVPLRRGFEPRPYAPLPDGLRILVFGGSQGARVLNERVPVALAKATSGVTVVHQCGKTDEAAVRQRYTELGAGARATVTPFIDDMPAALAKADLVIGRAGASTVSELCAVGRPSLLIPLPAAGDHQRHNALALEKVGAALCLHESVADAERIAAEIDRLGADRASLHAMAESARKHGRPHAADEIAKDLLELAGIAPGVDDIDAGWDAPAQPPPSGPFTSLVFTEVP